MVFKLIEAHRKKGYLLDEKRTIFSVMNTEAALRNVRMNELSNFRNQCSEHEEIFARLPDGDPGYEHFIFWMTGSCLSNSCLVSA